MKKLDEFLIGIAVAIAITTIATILILLLHTVEDVKVMKRKISRLEKLIETDTTIIQRHYDTLYIRRTK